MTATWVAAFSSFARGEDLPGLRRRVQHRLRQEGASPRLVEKVGVLVSELAHNAAESGRRGSRVHVVLQQHSAGLRLSVECCDNRDCDRLARGLARARTTPRPEAERGRGLWLVQHYARGLEVERGRGGWVRLVLEVDDEGADREEA